MRLWKSAFWQKEIAIVCDCDVEIRDQSSDINKKTTSKTIQNVFCLFCRLNETEKVEIEFCEAMQVFRRRVNCGRSVPTCLPGT